MNLKNFLALKDKPPELFWSLVIEPGWVQAGIWYIGESVAEVISVSPGAAWEEEGELVGACDAALSSCVQKLPEEYTEPEKTVFGVPSSWVKGGEILESHLAKIKKICTDLSLTPVGFVVLPEAIAHLYKSEEGAGVSAIVLGLGNENLEVSVFSMGNLVGTTTVARSVSIIEDTIEGLSRFEGATPLPSRFILYDGKGGMLDEAKEEILKATWEDAPKIKFLHTPKVETLTSERKVLATSLAGANELGSVSKVVSKEEDETVEIDSEPKPEAEEVEEVAPEHENLGEPKDSTTPEELGFVVGGDVSQKPETQPSPVSFNVKPKLPFNKVSMPKMSMPKISFKFGKRNQPFIFAAVGILIVAFLTFVWFYPKAKVTIYVSPKTYSQESDIKFDTSGSSDTTSGVIPAAGVSVEVTGEKTRSTTGTKLIGEKAKGSVQIANGNAASINLVAGTILTSSGGLKFVTDSEASVSGQLLPGSPGTQLVNVTAGDIGANYNLAKGEIFAVGNFSKSLVAGTSQTDFSGGSSQQISAVSKEDQSALETELKNELTQNAKDQLSSKVTDTQVFIDDLVSVDISSESFDHKVGDEAGNLKLTLTLKATAILADKAKLLEYAGNVLSQKTPDGYVLRSTQITFQFAKDKVTMNANFLPKVDTDALIVKVSGKSLLAAKNYLMLVPGFTRVEIALKPRLPGILGTLPHVHKHILVDVVAER